MREAASILALMQRGIEHQDKAPTPPIEETPNDAEFAEVRNPEALRLLAHEIITVEVYETDVREAASILGLMQRRIEHQDMAPTPPTEETPNDAEFAEVRNPEALRLLAQFKAEEDDPP